MKMHELQEGDRFRFKAAPERGPFLSGGIVGKLYSYYDANGESRATTFDLEVILADRPRRTETPLDGQRP